MSGKEKPPGRSMESKESPEHLIDIIGDALRAFQELPAAERERRIGPHLPESLFPDAAEGVVDLQRKHSENIHLAWCSDCRDTLHRTEREYFERLRTHSSPVEFSIGDNSSPVETPLIHTRPFHADLLRVSGDFVLRITCDQASDFANVRIDSTPLQIPAPKRSLAREVLEIVLGPRLSPETEVEIGFDYCGASWAKRVRFVA